MKNTNERATMMNRVKTKTAEVISSVLIRQANTGHVKSGLLFISEPKVPIELIKESLK